MALVTLSLDADKCLSHCLRHAVDVCVFDDGLQDHSGYQRIECFRFYRNIMMHSSVKPCFLNGQIELNKVHFFGKWNQLLLSPVKSDTQHAAQLFQHLIGSLYIASHQARNAIHCVEKKVRVELHAQRAQLRLCQLLRSGRFAFPKALIGENYAKETEDEPEDD